MPDAKLLSLFAGAGGLDLGLEEAGFRTVAASELTDYACATLRSNKLIPTLTPEQFERWFDVQLSQKCYRGASEREKSSQRARIGIGNSLAHRFLSQAYVLEGDIRALSSNDIASAARVRRGELTLVAGGPPCQPFSRAGKRESVETEDGRLFREFVRIVRDLAPRWFLFENVKGLGL
jgi:DNA (cytosine-5)-methyltransferase 1